MAQTVRWAMTENIKNPAKGTSLNHYSINYLFICLLVNLLIS